jgi:hypothetical protein
MEAAEAGDSNPGLGTSVRSAISDRTETKITTERSSEPAATQPDSPAKSRSSRRQDAKAPSTTTDPLDPDAGSESDADTDEDDSTEESDSESEENSEESEADSSFEAASASSDDDIPVRKTSRRRSTATNQIPAKARKSSLAVTRPAILEESEDEDSSTATRPSTLGISVAKNTAQDKATPSSPEAPKTRKTVAPINDKADLQLDENTEPTTPDVEAKAEPAKKKKRWGSACIS